MYVSETDSGNPVSMWLSEGAVSVIGSRKGSSVFSFATHVVPLDIPDSQAGQMPNNTDLLLAFTVRVARFYSPCSFPDSPLSDSRTRTFGCPLTFWSDKDTEAVNACVCGGTRCDTISL